MKNPLLVYLGYNIRTERSKKNLSQEDLANLVGVHRTYIGMVERAEKNVTILTLEKIAHALGLSISELIEGSFEK